MLDGMVLVMKSKASFDHLTGYFKARAVVWYDMKERFFQSYRDQCNRNPNRPILALALVKVVLGVLKVESLEGSIKPQMKKVTAMTEFQQVEGQSFDSSEETKEEEEERYVSLHHSRFIRVFSFSLIS
ncbi:hypothetical protein ACLOJK_037655 [Asimina triloba]